MTGPAQAHRSDAELVVLHTARVCGSLSLERLQTVVATLTPVDVEDTLLDLAARGLIRRDPGPFGGWGLTDAGRAADAAMIAAEVEQIGARADVEAAFDDFIALNQRTLDICGAWQVRSWEPMVLNDHADEVYDARVLGRLAAVDAEVQRICERLSARLHRFSHYGPRLAHALQRARGGDLDLVTNTLDSYHTVWFQLHEDLLVTLGRSREGGGDRS